MTLTHPNMVLLLRELDFGPGTIHDLRDALGIELRSTQRAVKAARRLHKVRIVSWERSRGGRPVYGKGSGVDAPRPSRLTAAEKQRRWRAKKPSVKPGMWTEVRA